MDSGRPNKIRQQLNQRSGGAEHNGAGYAEYASCASMVYPNYTKQPMGQKIPF
jgi:hypothetical protein